MPYCRKADSRALGPEWILGVRDEPREVKSLLRVELSLSCLG